MYAHTKTHIHKNYNQVSIYKHKIIQRGTHTYINKSYINKLGITYTNTKTNTC